MVTWTHQAGDYYLIVGKDKGGKRFRKQSDNYHYLAAHNVWQGTLYHVRGEGNAAKRTVLKRWFN